ncbi:hypothetical protein [Kineococcus rhizosphaerae]|uniref:NYN domain-containing protein n=1 Tax=Kineococcus rhizosphaerae TaxID=559628 RepID=A0A2T0R1U2_9ACTN|nr:hypothetical protein [Kineococcus rhizosphaerae]PRY13516.1 hypothetical protein CLV37_108186 [Kineococcus rhizosphaerae]
MGLGGAPGEYADYEWFDLADVPAPEIVRPGPDPLSDALRELVRGYPVWAGEGATRVLLVDLDNLRAGPSRLRARLSVVLDLARQADRVALAGQVGAVARSQPWLEEFASRAQAVPDGADVADLALLAAARKVPDPVEFVVVSNDGIFADLAERGDLTLLSPGMDALSDRLYGAASLLVDLAALEAEAAASLGASRT